MDPDANVDEQHRLCEQSRQHGPDWPGRARARARMQELRQALDEWLAAGGFAPPRAQPGDDDVRAAGL